MIYFFAEEIQTLALRATTQKISYETASWLGDAVQHQFLFHINKDPSEMKNFFVEMFGKYLGESIEHLARYGIGRKRKREEEEAAKRAWIRMNLKIRGADSFDYLTLNLFYQALEVFIEEMLKTLVRVFGEPIRKKRIKEMIREGDFSIFFDQKVTRSEKVYLKFSEWKYKMKL
jgi:hypothetical protein